MKIEVDKQEFEKLIKYVETLKTELQKCQKINKFLNEQIKEYNSKFTKGAKNEKAK